MTSQQDKLLPTLDFLLFEWLGLADLLDRPRYADHDRESIDQLLRATADIAATYYQPANRVVDDQEPRVEDGRVVLPRETADAWRATAEFGFLLATQDVEHGGMQLPHAAGFATQVVLAAASISINAGLLTEANAALLLAHGTPAQQEVFATRELSGEWAGTMCLSESQAGSSLSDITTSAVPDGDDFEDDPLGPRFRLTGQKMWISGGDHELTENIIHLVLAKTAGPDGTIDPSTRGISLFVVPKMLVDPDGTLRERNDVSLVSLNHKLGYRGIPNAALAFGDGSWEPGGARGAIGYLVGRPGDGLRQMFHMMNAARIAVGLGAAALGYAGFEASLAYARDRRQGRHLTRTGKDATTPMVPLVEHADVKRMLLAQKAYAEGGIALGLFAARLLDEQATRSAGDAADAADAADTADTGALLEILTPVVKSWPSEWCLEANSLAIQVLGGAGYTRDFPVEQYWRDNRLNMIHEGTHGIQALDLLGRKVIQDDGAGLRALGRRLTTTVDRARGAGLTDEAAQVEAAWARAVDTAAAAWATGDPEEALANATPYLQAFGHVVLAWIWLDVAVTATASEHPEAAGAGAAMRYFLTYELPKVEPWLAVVARREPLCRELDPDVL